MLPPETLYQTVNYAQQRLFHRLARLYEALPGTTCARCGDCCAESPPAFLIEYLYAYQYIKNNLRPMWPDILARAIEYFFLELADAQLRCPFLDGANTCLIYPVRPYLCRAYGLVRPEQLPVKKRDPAATQELASHHRQFGLTIPEEIIRGSQPACSRARPERPVRAPEKLVHGVFTGLAMLETELVPVSMALRENTLLPLSTHLALTVLPPGALTRRIRILKEYLEEGHKLTLARYVNQARTYTF